MNKNILSSLYEINDDDLDVLVEKTKQEIEKTKQEKLDLINKIFDTKKNIELINKIIDF